MKRLILAVAVCLDLVACAPMPPQRSGAEIIASNPSTSCLNTLAERPSLAALRQKMPFKNNDTLTLAARSDASMPSAAEKAMLEEYWQGRLACFTLEGNYIPSNYPPPVVPIAMENRSRKNNILTQLYEGRIGYSGFIAAFEEINRSSDAQVATVQSQMAAREQEDRQRRAQAAAIALQGLGQQMQQQAAQQQQFYQNQQIINQMNRPVQTNCQRFGNQTSCTTY